MWSAWFQRVKTLFVVTVFAKASEFETSRKIAYVNERLHNNFLIPADANSMALPLTDHEPLQVRSQNFAGRS